MDWDWPRLGEGGHVEVNVQMTNAKFLVYCTVEDDTFNTAVSKLVEMYPAIDAREAFTLNTHLNPTCGRAKINTRFKGGTLLIMRFWR